MLLAVSGAGAQPQTDLRTQQQPDALQAADLLGFTPEDYVNMSLPPLEVLYEASRNSPNVEYFNLRKAEEESALRSEKKNWLQYFKVTSTYQYGIMGESSNILQPDNSIYYQSNQRAQNWWNVGAGISIPLNDLFDRRNRTNRQKMRVLQTEQEIEKWHDEQKLKIIEMYTLALQSLAILRIKAEALVLADAQYQASQTDFINGQINAAELARLKSIQTTANVEYEQTKAELNNALLQLEVLANVKIIRNK